MENEIQKQQSGSEKGWVVGTATFNLRNNRWKLVERSIIRISICFGCMEARAYTVRRGARNEADPLQINILMQPRLSTKLFTNSLGSIISGVQTIISPQEH